MKIGICTLGSDHGRSGIGEYVKETIRSLEAAASHHTIEVFLLRKDEAIYAPRGERNQAVTLPSSLENAVASIAWHHSGLPWLCWRRGIDVVLLTAANRRLPLHLPCPAVGTVHDLSIFHQPDKYDSAHRLYTRSVVAPLLQTLDHVIAVSEWTRQDLLRLTTLRDDQVTVVHNGVDSARFHPAHDPAAAERLARICNVRKPYLLCVARLEHPGKNHVGLLEAYARLRQHRPNPLHLVLVGPRCERAEEILALVEAHPHARDIHYLGYVDAALLPDLYREAEALVMPSRAEGFGLPVVEAMASGTVVVSSQGGALPEVGGDAAIYFDPLDTVAMAAALSLALDDAAERQRRRALGLAQATHYSWSTAGQRTLEILEKVAHKP
jgi:glycosyltransferase involved in cell wall biosynthesis